MTVKTVTVRYSELRSEGYNNKTYALELSAEVEGHETPSEVRERLQGECERWVDRQFSPKVITDDDFMERVEVPF